MQVNVLRSRGWELNPHRAALQAYDNSFNGRNITIRIPNKQDVINDFIVYLTIDERLSQRLAKQCGYIAKRFLKDSKGIVSRDNVRNYLRKFLSMKPTTYNNQLKGLRAFIMRFLGRPEIIEGFRKAPVLITFEEIVLPSRAQLRAGFSVLNDDRERAMFMLYKDSGLRRSELTDLTKSDIDFQTKAVKSKHNTRTKRAGITFYTTETEQYLKKHLTSRRDDKERLFRFDKNVFYRMWVEVSEAAEIKITPQVLRKWEATTLGENGCPDRYVDIFQGRAPRTVLAKYYTGKELLRLNSIYDKFSKGLKILA